MPHCLPTLLDCFAGRVSCKTKRISPYYNSFFLSQTFVSESLITGKLAMLLPSLQHCRAYHVGRRFGKQCATTKSRPRGKNCVATLSLQISTMTPSVLTESFWKAKHPLSSFPLSKFNPWAYSSRASGITGKSWGGPEAMPPPPLPPRPSLPMLTQGQWGRGE